MFMQSPDGKMGKRRQANGWFRPLIPLISSPFVAVVLIGCAHNDRRPGDARSGDPLVGGPAAPAAGGSILAPPVPVDKVPPIPVASSTAGNAALAGGPPKPLTGGNDLRITTGAVGTVSTPPTLSPPIARPAESATVVPVARGVSGASPRVGSYEQALAQLSARGVKWRRLETIGENGETKFSCSIPNPKNQYISRTYEARAQGDLAAIQAVLDQIEREGPGGNGF
ncbi:MAG: hypothetical protein K2R98_00665 [Gemmataceae bacterium]|nr:hypothetical protein [Gemmataceae bacterium]